MNRPSTIVYVIQMGNLDLYKVGKSSYERMNDRLRTLQKGNPIKLKYIFTEYHGPVFTNHIEDLLIDALKPYKTELFKDWFMISRDRLNRYIG
jgi:hypothetical protein